MAANKSEAAKPPLSSLLFIIVGKSSLANPPTPSGVAQMILIAGMWPLFHRRWNLPHWLLNPTPLTQSSLINDVDDGTLDPFQIPVGFQAMLAGELHGVRQPDCLEIIDASRHRTN